MLDPIQDPRGPTWTFLSNAERNHHRRSMLWRRHSILSGVQMPQTQAQMLNLSSSSDGDYNSVEAMVSRRAALFDEHQSPPAVAAPTSGIARALEELMEGSGDDDAEAEATARFDCFPVDIVPAQTRDPTDACGGRWLEVATGSWCLMNNITEVELLAVQMRLHDWHMELEQQQQLEEMQQQQQQQQQAPPKKRALDECSTSEATPPPRREKVAVDTVVPLCCACNDAASNVMFVECHHVCVCTGCDDKLKEHAHGRLPRCPICTGASSTVQLLFP